MADLLVFFRKNNIEVVNLTDGRRSEGSAEFTTTRLLVGGFREADVLLSKLVKDVGARSIFSRRPRLVIQPLEMTEGGLSMVEERIFLELGVSTGARVVKLHIGSRLSEQIAVQVLSGNV